MNVRSIQFFLTCSDNDDLYYTHISTVNADAVFNIGFYFAVPSKDDRIEQFSKVNILEDIIKCRKYLLHENNDTEEIRKLKDVSKVITAMQRWTWNTIPFYKFPSILHVNRPFLLRHFLRIARFSGFLKHIRFSASLNYISKMRPQYQKRTVRCTKTCHTPRASLKTWTGITVSPLQQRSCFSRKFTNFQIIVHAVTVLAHTRRICSQQHSTQVCISSTLQIFPPISHHYQKGNKT